jgi:hypothetical protein
MMNNEANMVLKNNCILFKQITAERGCFMNKARVLFASVSGSVIEWYDFYLYGTATGLVFSQLFFPSVNPATALLLAFATHSE